MDAGVITSSMRWYAHTNAKLAVDRLDVGCFENYCNFFLRQVISSIYEVWYGTDGDLIKKYRENRIATGVSVVLGC